MANRNPSPKPRKPRRVCRVAGCGAEFDTLADFGVHVSTEHDLRRGGADSTPLRAVSCWRCAREIDVNVTRTCECGFTLPDDRPAPAFGPLAAVNAANARR